MKDDTIGPVITWTTEGMLSHVDKLLKIPGARLAFGGKELEGHTVPKVYGAIQPTAVFVPLKEILKDEETFKTVTTEVFGPLQVSLVYPFIKPPRPLPPAFQPLPRIPHLVVTCRSLRSSVIAPPPCCIAARGLANRKSSVHCTVFACSFTNDIYVFLTEKWT